MNSLRSPLYFFRRPARAPSTARSRASAHGGKGAGVNGFRHERAGHAEVQRQLAHPLAGALGPGGIHDAIDQVSAGLRIADAEDVAGDLDEIAVQLGAVPGVEDFVQFVVREIEGLLEQPVRLADQLHVAVLDAVVDHFDVMPAPRGPTHSQQGMSPLGPTLAAMA